MKITQTRLLLLTVLIAVGCQKNDIGFESTEDDSRELSLEVAESHYRKLTRSVAKRSNPVLDSTLTELLWSRAYQSEQRGKRYVEVPASTKRKQIALYRFPADSVKYEPDESVGEWSMQRLLFFKNASGKMEERLLTYIPDKAYLMERKAEMGLNTIRKMQDRFSGYLEYRSIDMEVIRVLRIEDGVVVRSYVPSASAEIVQPEDEDTMSPASVDCYNICTPIWQYVCESYLDDENIITLECSTQQTGQTCQTYCSGEPGTDPDPDPWPPGGGGSASATNHIAVAPVSSINLQSRIECFNSVPSNSSTQYKITIHVHSAVQGSPAVEYSFSDDDPGHAYITLEKSNGSNIQRLSFGFYPKVDTWVSINKLPIASGIGEEYSNLLRRSDIRLTRTITATKFNNAISQALTSSGKLYDLNDYNCTDYALEVFNSTQTGSQELDVPNSNIGYTTPAGLYGYLDQKRIGGDSGVSNVSSRPPISTNCN